MATDVIIPALGESITEATVGEWLKAPGDKVAADEPIVSLETDKVAVEVPSPVAGTMGEQLFKVGDTVTIGVAIARVEAGGDAPAKADAPTPAVVKDAAPATKAEAAAPAPAASAAPAAEAEPQAAPGPAPKVEPAPAPAAATAPAAEPDPMAPAVRRLIGDYNLDPKSITGTGLDGRLTKGDVLAAIEAGTAKQLGAPAAAAAPAAAPPLRRSAARSGSA